MVRVHIDGTGQDVFAHSVDDAIRVSVGAGLEQPHDATVIDGHLSRGTTGRGDHSSAADDGVVCHRRQPSEPDTGCEI